MSMFLYSVFRTEGNFQIIVATISFLFVVPFLYIRLILKRSLNEFGIQKGDWRKGFLYSIFSILILTFIFYLFFNNFNFIEKYYLPASIVSNFKYFIFREVVKIGFFIALYEFFFRGFIMFYFSDKFKSCFYPIVIQSLIFYVFLIAVDSFGWATSPYILIAPLAGLVAYKSHSIIYSFVFSWISVLAIDTVFIKIIVSLALK